jgi:hypothetical protein
VVTGAGGTINLSIPLMKGRNQKTLIKDTRIDDGISWQAQHWKTIVSCYNRSPWFEFYRDELFKLYTVPFQFLVDWNFACFSWMIEKLNLNLAVSLTEQWRPVYDGPDWDDWRNRLLPKTINQLFPNAPKYKQVFEDRIGFIPHLSVLDLLFCEGKNTRVILSQ